MSKCSTCKYCKQVEVVYALDNQNRPNYSFPWVCRNKKAWKIFKYLTWDNQLEAFTPHTPCKFHEPWDSIHYRDYKLYSIELNIPVSKKQLWINAIHRYNSKISKLLNIKLFKGKQ